MTSTDSRNFTQGELGFAVMIAVFIEAAFFAVLITAGANRGAVNAAATPAPSVIPIAVQPVLDDAPLLKLGSKKMRPKLPDLWKKNPPIQRYEATSAPSPQADKNPSAIPSTPVATKDAGPPPPPDAAVAKHVDQVLLDAGAAPKSAAHPQGEGSEDGIKGGTETDPLKARAVGQYTQLIISWFNARFRQPDIECETLKALKATVSATLGPDRTVTGFSVLRPSGNAQFDERVHSTMSSIVGQQIPPPPPLYPDIARLPSVTFRGQCK